MSLHGRQTTAKGVHTPISWTFADAAARTSFTPTLGIPYNTGQLTSEDLYKLGWQEDIGAVFLLTAISPLTWKQLTPASVTTSTNQVIVNAIKGTAGTIPLGSAVYITGYDDGNTAIEVELAQADSVSTMNAIGLVSAVVTDASSGAVTINGEVDGLDTSSYSVNDSIHVSATVAGGLTNVPPAGPAIHQNIGSVLKVDASDGRILVSYQAEEPLSDTAPSAVGSAASGTSAIGSRADHVHAHGNQGGGSLHADVVAAGASGFMTGSDKTKLDGIATGSAALTSSAPADVTRAAAAVGVATTAARADHKHDVTVAAPGATGVATASGAGSASTLARSDHTHQSNTAPVNVTKAAAAIGTSGQPARADHKHDVTTATAGATQAGASAAEGAATSLARSDHAHSVAVATPSAIGAANAEGAATSFVRSDHVHAHGAQTDGTMHAEVIAAGASGFMSGSDKTKLDGIAAGSAALTSTAPVDVTKAAAAVGVGTTAARHDHKHDISTAAPGATGIATASGEGAATSLARSDHTHQSNTAPVNVTKAAAAIGTSGEPARADHKHDVSTAAAGATQAGASAAEGTATSLARSDHAHSVAVATPSTIGTANSAGAATSFVRSDHVHAHGAQTDGTLHAAVVAAGASGFMTGADKTKLDAIPAGASGQVQYHNGAGGLGAEAGFEYDAAGDQLTVPGLTVTQDVLFTGVISPGSLGSSQNNYAPTGFATATTLRLTSSTAINITGLAGGANGRFIILHNIGANNITLSNSSGSSTAANQFLFNADIVLASNQSTTIRYDGTSSRWRVTGGTGSGGGTTSFRKVYTAYDFESPFVNYAQNGFAAVAADTANAGLLVRRFDDTALEGVGFGLTVPSTATSLTMYFKSRAQSTPGGTVNVVPVLYSRSLPDNAAVGAWNGGTTLTSIAFTTNTNWQYDSQTITLATLGLTAGNYVQFELVRNGAAGGDTLSGDWCLLELIMEFT